MKDWIWLRCTNQSEQKQITFCPETDFCLVIRYSFPMLTSITSFLLDLFSSVVIILAWGWWDWLIGALPRLCPSRDLKTRFPWIREGPLEVVTAAIPIYGSSLWDWRSSKWFQHSPFIQQKPLDSNCSRCTANPHKTVTMGVQGNLAPFDSGKSQDRVMNLLHLLRLWGYCTMGLWFDIGEDLGERRSKTEYLLRFQLTFRVALGRS